jgi:hypothetical protein
MTNDGQYTPERPLLPVLSHLRVTQRNKIIYCTSTVLLASGMLAGGLEQVFHTKRIVNLFVHLGYPFYFLYKFGVWQILGVIAILIAEFRLLKEWAYAGIVFNMTGATAAVRAFMSGSTAHIVAPLVIYGVAIVSWMLRPESRKLNPTGIANIDQKKD